MASFPDFQAHKSQQTRHRNIFVPKIFIMWTFSLAFGHWIDHCSLLKLFCLCFHSSNNLCSPKNKILWNVNIYNNKITEFLGCYMNERIVIGIFKVEKIQENNVPDTIQNSSWIVAELLTVLFGNKTGQESYLTKERR